MTRKYPQPNKQGAYPQYDTPGQAMRALKKASKRAQRNGDATEAKRLSEDAADIEENL